jgi:hypothetical protein
VTVFALSIFDAAAMPANSATADTAIGGAEGMGFVSAAGTSGANAFDGDSIVVLELGELNGAGNFHNNGTLFSAFSRVPWI